MAQADGIVSNASGAAVRADLNNQLAAVFTNHSGATEPSTTYAYQWWADTVNGVMKLRNATNTAWITLFQLDGEWTTLAVENGSAASPSIYFKDSGTDTGVYSPGTDQVAITTAGAQRVNFNGTTEVVFNDGGADVDFRIEGDTEENLFKIDAGTDQVQVKNLNGGPLAGTRNRIINGDMRIDQRNAGASVTVNTGNQTFCVDRWFGQSTASAGVFTLQRSTTAPAGFTNSLLATVSTVDSSLAATDLYALSHNIEGFNVADLDWGTANARAITLSFWVRSSVTGTFGGSISNSAADRSYPFTYSIASANTFEYKTIIIAGDTSGTWLRDNGVGLRVYWGFGLGSTYSGTAGAWAGALYISATGATNLMATNGSTFYITGVQLEPGTVATPFERRSYGQELALCQRYFQIVQASTRFLASAVSQSTSGSLPFQSTMRSAPTAAVGTAVTTANAGTTQILRITAYGADSNITNVAAGDSYALGVPINLSAEL